MPIRFQEVAIAGNGAQAAVTFDGPVVEAHAVLQGYGALAPDLIRVEVDSIVEKQVTVKLTIDQSLDSAWVLVIANVNGISSIEPALEILVSWNDGRPAANPENAKVDRPRLLKWVPDLSDPCNIIGILGLGQQTFGETTSRSEGAGSLLWTCPDYYTETSETPYNYAILAEKGGRIGYTDPKITNDPMNPIPPEE